LRRFPVDARSEIGYQSALVQQGFQPFDWKPISIVGSGVIEIRVHAQGEFRVFYVAKFEEAVYVLHVFVKKTRKTSLFDIELGRKRYADLQARRKQ
jgi:phage-related protein